MLRGRTLGLLLSLALAGCVDRFDVGGDLEVGTTAAQETTTGSSQDSGDGVGPGGVSSTDDQSSEPVCGNSIVEDGEECDEGDPVGLCTGCEHCQLRRTAYFDGETSFIEVEDVEGKPLQLADTDFTIEAWMGVGTFEDVVRINRRVNDAPAVNGGYWLRLEKESLLAYMTGSGASFDVGVITNGWHHVAWTFDGTTSRLFLDGTALGEATTRIGMTPAETRLSIGRLALTNQSVFERGWIDEVRISNVVRYGAAGFEPIRRFEPDDDTLLLLHLDGEAIDESPLGHDVSAIDVVWEPDDGYGREAFCDGGGR